MINPRISIIIPTYNEEETLDDLLAYLKKNTGNSIHEIIIADGGSSDNTLSIAKKHKVIIVHCSRKGRAAQMNEGAEKASGSVFYFLHADTYPPEKFAEHITRTIRIGYPSGCFRLRFDDPQPALKLYGWFTRFPLTLFRFGDQSLFMQSELFQRVGGFDESMIVMEDQKIVSELKKESKFKVIEASVTTSARRYKNNGEIRLQCVFALIVLLYYLGANQETLVHIYQSFVVKKSGEEN